VKFFVCLIAIASTLTQLLWWCGIQTLDWLK